MNKSNRSSFSFVAFSNFCRIQIWQSANTSGYGSDTTAFSSVADPVPLDRTRIRSSDIIPDPDSDPACYITNFEKCTEKNPEHGIGSPNKNLGMKLAGFSDKIYTVRNCVGS